MQSMQFCIHYKERLLNEDDILVFEFWKLIAAGSVYNLSPKIKQVMLVETEDCFASKFKLPWIIKQPNMLQCTSNCPAVHQ